MNVKHAAGKSRAHFATVVTIHAKGSTLAERLVAVGELAKASSREDRWIRRLEVPVNNQSAIVDKAVVMDALKDVRVYITMSTSDQNASFELQLVLLATLLFFGLASLSVLSLRFVVVLRIFITRHASCTTFAFRLASVLVFVFILFFFVVDLIELLKEKCLKHSTVSDVLLLISGVEAVITEGIVALFIWLFLVFVSDDLHQFDLLDDLNAFLL